MGSEFKNKKNLIFIVIFILLLLIGGFFWWWQQPKSQLRKWWIEEIEMKGSIKDFFIKEVPEGKFVENKKEGLRVKAPEGWSFEKGETSSFAVWGINLFSPNKSCMVGVYIENSNLHFDLANLYIQNSKNIENNLSFEETGYEVIKIDQKQALKELIYDDPKIGIEIGVRIPTKNNKNIYFVLRSSSEDKDKCVEEFNNFLSTVVINK